MVIKIAVTHLKKYSICAELLAWVVALTNSSVSFFHNQVHIILRRWKIIIWISFNKMFEFFALNLCFKKDKRSEIVQYLSLECFPSH